MCEKSIRIAPTTPIARSVQRISTILVSESKFGHALLKTKGILQIKQKTFVLLLIKQRYFLEHPVHLVLVNCSEENVLVVFQSIDTTGSHHSAVYKSDTHYVTSCTEFRFPSQALRKACH